MKGIEQILPPDDPCKIMIGLFGEQYIPVFVFVSEKGYLIFRYSIAVNFSGILAVVAYLPEEVQGNIGQGDIGFQIRSVAAQFRKPVTQNQGIVGQEKKILVVHLIFWDGTCALKHPANRKKLDGGTPYPEQVQTIHLKSQGRLR
jgi:hypothetical protein